MFEIKIKNTIQLCLCSSIWTIWFHISSKDQSHVKFCLCRSRMFFGKGILFYNTLLKTCFFTQNVLTAFHRTPNGQGWGQYWASAPPGRGLLNWCSVTVTRLSLHTECLWGWSLFILYTVCCKVISAYSKI